MDLSTSTEIMSVYFTQSCTQKPDILLAYKLFMSKPGFNMRIQLLHQLAIKLKY